MKRIFTSLLAFLGLVVYGQHCASDQYLNSKISQDTSIVELLNARDQFLKPFQHHVQKSGANYVIPTVVYIIHNGGPENISDQQINSQMDALNDHFSFHGLSFCLAQADSGNAFTEPTPGIFRINSALTDHQMTNDAALK